MKHARMDHEAPDVWMAATLDDGVETLEELIDFAYDQDMTAVAHKLEEALGPLRSAQTAATQYHDGVLTYKTRGVRDASTVV